MMSIATVRMRSASLFLAIAILSACESRSISNTSGSNPFYRGELSQFAVLGLDPQKPITEAEIAAASVTRRPISMRKGDGILLVQSGAPFPDREMTEALDQNFEVAGFSGIPEHDNRYGQSDVANARTTPYAQLYRLAAARGGYKTVVVYWGVLESATKGLATKGISWVPVIGGIVPDEEQRMRIRILTVVIDVMTGQWDTFETEPFDSDAISNSNGRSASDLEQIVLLKSKAYKAAAKTLIDRYAAVRATPVGG